MSGTLANHLATFYQLSRYILECNAQVTESQLFWNNPKLSDDMYGFMLDFGYLVAVPDGDRMYVRLSPLWEAKMRAHHNIPYHVVQWSKAAEDELARYAKLRNLTKERTAQLRHTIETESVTSDYIGLLAVLRVTTPQ